jgi:hypothetical protein
LSGAAQNGLGLVVKGRFLNETCEPMEVGDGLAEGLVSFSTSELGLRGMNLVLRDSE